MRIPRPFLPSFISQSSRKPSSGNVLGRGVRCWAIGVVVLVAVWHLPASAELVQYELTFNSTWSSTTHPVDFPDAAHFSGLWGASHDSDFSLWRPGDLSSVGIQKLAELGAGSPVDQELAAAREAGSVFDLVRMSGLNTSPASGKATFPVQSTHPLVSFATMIAPSPDWIVGAHDVSLQEDGIWIPEITIDAFPYDAGTDSGVSYRSENLVTEPQIPIYPLSDGVFEGAPRMGTFTLRLLSTPGDFNGSGGLDLEDVNILCFRQGENHPRYELTGDNTISLDDVAFLVERIGETRAGDTNFDGSVDFGDFVTLSANFGRSGEWSHGDFDCNRQIEFSDFLQLSENFGFGGDAATASVPEPSSSIILMALLAGLPSLVRRMRITL